MLGRMFQPLAGATLSPLTISTASIIIGFIFLGHLIGRAKISASAQTLIPAPVIGVGLAVLFLLIQLLIPEQGRPFIYFQF